MEETTFEILDSKVPKKPNSSLLIVCYTIYVIVWELLVWIGAGYVYFILGKSGWWMVLAFILSTSYIKTHNWYSLWDGVERKDKK